MIHYKMLYLKLFNAITDALEAMEAQNFGQAKELLRQAQIDAEEAYLDQTEKEQQTVDHFLLQM